MTTFKTEQKHENQKENKKITEIDEKQKKIDENYWKRWVSRIHKKTQQNEMKTQKMKQKHTEIKGNAKNGTK